MPLVRRVHFAQLNDTASQLDTIWGQRYKASLPTDTLLPPRLNECRLHDKAVQAMIRAVGDPKIWDEKTCQPQFAMAWFQSVMQYATLANIDPATVMMARLTDTGKQWLTSILPTRSFAEWHGGGGEAFANAYRSRFAHQVRDDHTLALEQLVNKGINQGGQKLEAYTEKFNMLIRRLPADTISPAMQCAQYIKGLDPVLLPKCKFTTLGTEWTDLDALIHHCGIQAFLLAAGDTQVPYKRGYRARLNAAKLAAAALPSAKESNNNNNNNNRGHTSNPRGASNSGRGGRGQGSKPPSNSPRQDRASGSQPAAADHGYNDHHYTPASAHDLYGCNLVEAQGTEFGWRQTGRLSTDEYKALRKAGICQMCRGVLGTGYHYPRDCPAKDSADFKLPHQ
jgi:hypothetical protein